MALCIHCGDSIFRVSESVQGKEAGRRRFTSQKQGVPLLGAGGDVDGGGLLPVPFTRNRYCTSQATTQERQQLTASFSRKDWHFTGCEEIRAEGSRQRRRALTGRQQGSRRSQRCRSDLRVAPLRCC